MVDGITNDRKGVGSWKIHAQRNRFSYVWGQLGFQMRLLEDSSRRLAAKKALGHALFFPFVLIRLRARLPERTTPKPPPPWVARTTLPRRDPQPTAKPAQRALSRPCTVRATFRIPAASVQPWALSSARGARSYPGSKPWGYSQTKFTLWTRHLWSPTLSRRETKEYPKASRVTVVEKKRSRDEEYWLASQINKRRGEKGGNINNNL